nr:MAG TPA: hypothetical protein [Bacteriophage sp.]
MGSQGLNFNVAASIAVQHHLLPIVSLTVHDLRR